MGGAIGHVAVTFMHFLVVIISGDTSFKSSAYRHLLVSTAAGSGTMKTLVVLVICCLILADVARLSTGKPYEGDSCLRIVTGLILEQCGKVKRSIMLQEVESALRRHRVARYSHTENVNNQEDLGELLGVPSDWAVDDLESLRRQYRRSLQHLWAQCCSNKKNCSKDLFKGVCK